MVINQATGYTLNSSAKRRKPAKHADPRLVAQVQMAIDRALAEHSAPLQPGGVSANSEGRAHQTTPLVPRGIMGRK